MYTGEGSVKRLQLSIIRTSGHLVWPMSRHVIVYSYIQFYNEVQQTNKHQGLAVYRVHKYIKILRLQKYRLLDLYSTVNELGSMLAC